jgi:exo-beta-1,3-glucanase (GH17 family)
MNLPSQMSVRKVIAVATSTVATIVPLVLFTSCSSPKLVNWPSKTSGAEASTLDLDNPQANNPVSDEKDSAPKACLLRNGLAYGPFRDGEGPGDPLPFATYEQMDEDLGFVSKLTGRIRTYGSSGKYADIPGLAKMHGLNVMLGIYLSKDQKRNEEEINAAIELARDQITLENTKRVNLVDSIIVGNETLSNSADQSLTGSGDENTKANKEKLVSYIRLVKEKLANTRIPVSTAQVASVWESNLDLAKEVDFVTAHFYPFWDKQPIDGAATLVIENYRKLKSDLRAKYGRDVRVVIGETGWPSGGGKPGPAVPSPENQRKYVGEFMKLACENSIEFYYFDAFDEEWKWNEGGDEEWKQLQERPKLRSSALPDDRTFSGRWTGASWGLFQSNGKLKPELGGLFDQPAPGSRANRDIFLEGPLSGFYDMGVDSWPGRKHEWVSTGSDTDRKGSLIMSYPAGQDAGAVFITVGQPTQPPRPWKDFSEFETLSIDMRGERGGERVQIGVKNRTDPDDDNEKRIVETLTGDYRTYRIALRDLASGHLKVPEGLRQLNVVAEFVFQGPRTETIYARNIRYGLK